MVELLLIVALLLFILVREWIMWKELQKLVDKIISRDYSEYTSGIREVIEAKKEKKDNDFNKMLKI